jgi:hypothetical protein
MEQDAIERLLLPGCGGILAIVFQRLDLPDYISDVGHG